MSLDNSGSADIPGNSRALFAVPGYQQTTLTINESLDVSRGASSEITQGSGSRTLFMVPGKLLRRDVQTTASYTWLGQLTDEHHSPFIGGVPLNVNGWSDLATADSAPRAMPCCITSTWCDSSSFISANST